MLAPFAPRLAGLKHSSKLSWGIRGQETGLNKLPRRHIPSNSAPPAHNHTDKPNGIAFCCDDNVVAGGLRPASFKPIDTTNRAKKRIGRCEDPPSVRKSCGFVVLEGLWMAP